MTYKTDLRVVESMSFDAPSGLPKGRTVEYAVKRFDPDTGDMLIVARENE